MRAASRSFSSVISTWNFSSRKLRKRLSSSYHSSRSMGLVRELGKCRM